MLFVKEGAGADPCPFLWKMALLSSKEPYNDNESVSGNSEAYKNEMLLNGSCCWCCCAAAVVILVVAAAVVAAAKSTFAAASADAAAELEVKAGKYEKTEV